MGSSPAAPAPIDSSGIFAEPNEPELERHIYPRWPWLFPFSGCAWPLLKRIAQPLIWLLANPHVVAPETLNLSPDEPMLIIANHVTTFDGPLVQYALPGRVRRRIAVAMAGDMLDDYRHFRNPERPVGRRAASICPDR